METIYVTNLKNGEISRYNNSKGDKEVMFKVQHDSATRKFPKFRIEFWLQGVYAKDYICVVGVPKYKFDLKENMDWIDIVDICLQSMEFNLNLYDEKYKINEDVVWLVIYTQNPNVKKSIQ